MSVKRAEELERKLNQRNEELAKLKKEITKDVFKRLDDAMKVNLQKAIKAL